MSNLRWPLSVDLAHPEYLAILVLLPFVVWLSLRSLAALRPARFAIAVTLRCLVIGAIAFAMAGPEWVWSTDDQTVVFLLDESNSISAEYREESLAFVKAAAKKMRPGKDRMAVVSFAGQAGVEQLPRADCVINQLSDIHERHRTDLAGAMRLGMALFPGDTAKRLVVLSDGNENVGAAISEADACASSNVPVDVVPYCYTHKAEIMVDELVAPASAKLDEVRDLQLVVRSQVNTVARLALYRNDKLVDLNGDVEGVSLPIMLEKGPNRFSIPVKYIGKGVHRFHAVIQPSDATTDALPFNNEGQAFTIVGDSDRVVIVSDATYDVDDVDAASAAALADSLRKSGIIADVISVRELPTDPAGLADCSAVILSNVSAHSLGRGRQEMLASYVRNLGGGLVVIGGDQAFCAGGYDGTPLEEVLPVEMTKAKLKFLSLSMVIVIDRSGSMCGEKLAMACNAAKGAVDLLNRFDQLGVIAFDGAPECVVPIQKVTDKSKLKSRIGNIGSGGGTVMYPALENAKQMLEGVDTNLRHIIVLTDGQSSPGPFLKLAQDCAWEGITISAIAVGPDADRKLLGDLARLSTGRMYVAMSGKPLPQIFARETMLARRAGIFERPFVPQIYGTLHDGMLSGFSTGDIPALDGHVVAAAKPTARTPLVRPTDDGSDPIMAYWQIGLGRSVAFTSGMWPRWGANWLAWAGFDKFWEQIVRYASRVSNSADLEVEMSLHHGQGHVSVNAEHLPLGVQGSLSVAAQVVGPDFSTTKVKLDRTSSGTFEGSFPANVPGTYVVNMPYSFIAGGAAHNGVVRSGVAVSYSPEYHTLQHNEWILREIARKSGGRVLSTTQANAIFEASSIKPVDSRRPFWEQLLQMAVALFIVDVAVRRIAISPSDVVVKARQFIHELAGRSPAVADAATMGALQQARARAREQVQRPSVLPTREDMKTVDLDVDDHADAMDSLSQALGAKEPSKPAVAPPPRRKSTVVSEGDYTSRLLRAKRRARGDDESAN